MSGSSALGHYIGQKRDALGFSQAALAEAVGRSRPYITQIENGKRSPSEETLQRIFSALGITLEQAAQDLLADEMDEQQYASVQYAFRVKAWMDANLTPEQQAEFSALVLDAEGFQASLALAGQTLPPGPAGWLNLTEQDRRLIQRLVNRLLGSSRQEAPDADQA